MVATSRRRDQRRCLRPPWRGGPQLYLVIGWVFHDLICRSVGRRRGGDTLVGILISAYVVAATWIACQLFAGRAAFVLTGAMLATIMSANVLMVMIPGQRKVMAQMKAGQPVDPIHGERAKQRSVHNTKVGFGQVKAVIEQRCLPCHNEAVAQKNVRLDSAEAIGRHAQQIYQQVVLMKLMPLGNATQITDEERALVGRWFNEGARVGG